LRGGLAPHPDIAAAISATAAELPGQWEIMWDLRGARASIPADVIDAVAAAQGEGRLQPILVPPGKSADVRWAVEDVIGLFESPVLEMRPKPLLRRQLDLALFDDDSVLDLLDSGSEDLVGADQAEYVKTAVELGIAPGSEFSGTGQREPDDVFFDGLERELATEVPPSERSEAETFQTLRQTWGAVRAKRLNALARMVQLVARNSLLMEIAVHFDGRGRVQVVPYHAYSLHQVAESDTSAVFVRPGRLSKTYWSSFEGAIQALESLLNDPDVKEKQLEELLVANPLFLRGLNYGDVYPQVVLPRQDSSDLRPDLIAEPLGEQWADIIDFKLPFEPILVGSADRPRLAAAITDAVAQLREYRAYFDDRSLAARIEALFGIKCYQPKMVVIVGRDPNRFTPEQQRRALTAHPDLEVVTYDRLLRAARSQLLL